eukprot:g17860.t1
MGEDFGEVLIVIDNVLKAAKNMASFLCSQEVLDIKGYPIRSIPYLSFEEVIVVFRRGTSELAIDELSIVSCSYEGILQHLLVSVSFLLIQADPVYCWAEVLCSKEVLFDLAHENIGILESESGPHGCSVCLDEEPLVAGEDVVVEDEVDELEDGIGKLAV